MQGKVFQAVLLKKDSALEKVYAELFKAADVDSLTSKIDSMMAENSNEAVIHTFEDWLAISPNDIYTENSADKALAKKVQKLVDEEKLLFTSPYETESNNEQLKMAVAQWQARSNFKVKAGQVLYLLEYSIEGPFFITDSVSDFGEAVKKGIVKEIITDEYSIAGFCDEHDFVVGVLLGDGSFSLLEDGALKKHSFTCYKITSKSLKSIEG